jgi:large subunit ribosomal protein L16
MALMPKRVKYRKSQRGSRAGVATRGSDINFGEFGLKVLANGWLKNTQIEAVRVVLARRLHGGGKMWLRVFPDKSVTKKPAETRMGKGKGDLDHWVAVVKKGKILVELGGVPEVLAQEAFRMCAYKLPLPVKFVKRMH